MAQTEKNEKESFKELQLVIFRIGDEEFGLDISQVREIIRMQEITPMPKAPVFIEGVINLRGQIIAVMELSKRLSLPSGERTDKSRIVVAEVGENILGLVVDEVPEVLRITENNIEPAPDIFEGRIHSDFIKGVGKCEDRLIILLDVDKIISRDEAKKVGEAVK